MVGGQPVVIDGTLIEKCVVGAPTHVKVAIPAKHTVIEMARIQRTGSDSQHIIGIVPCVLQIFSVFTLIGKFNKRLLPESSPIFS